MWTKQMCHVRKEYIKEGEGFTNNIKTQQFSTKGQITCTSANLVYGVFCKRCNTVVYVGETMNTLYQRHQQNLSRIRTGSQLDDLVQNFRPNNNHTLNDYQVFGVESISKDDSYRKAREMFWISKLGTLKPRGLNTKSC